jgi:hypothetical protein
VSLNDAIAHRKTRGSSEPSQYSEVNFTMKPEYAIGILLNPQSPNAWTAAADLIKASKAIRRSLPEMMRISTNLYVKQNAKLVRVRSKSHYNQILGGGF